MKNTKKSSEASDSTTDTLPSVVQLHEAESTDIRDLDNQLGRDKLHLADIDMAIHRLELERSAVRAKITEQSTKLVDKLQGCMKSHGLVDYSKNAAEPTNWNFDFGAMTFTKVAAPAKN